MINYPVWFNQYVMLMETIKISAILDRPGVMPLLPVRVI
jgi:hypothetical protein